MRGVRETTEAMNACCNERIERKQMRLLCDGEWVPASC